MLKMNSCFKNNTNDSITIHCDKNQIIKRIHKSSILGFNDKELLGSHISVLIPKQLKQTHSTYVTNMKENLKDFKYYKNKLKRKNDNFNNIVHINTKFGQNLDFNIKVDLNKDCSSKCTLTLVDTNLHIDTPQVPLDFMKYVNDRPSFHVKSYEDVICVMMDICNSTSFGLNRSSQDIASTYYNLIKLVYEMVTMFYHPFVIVHETVGDSIFLLLNIKSITLIHDNIHSFAINMSIELTKVINCFLSKQDDNMYIRCGISSGEVSGGVIDGKTFRVFGNCVNKASRLESTCNKNEIIIDNSILQHLKLSEDDLMSIQTKEIHLKGIGVETVYILDNKILY